MYTEQQWPAFDALCQQVQMRRYGGDCYNYGLLASGHIDLVVEGDLKYYDITALVPVVEGAGGPITLDPIEVNHGRIDALGFKIGGLAYIPDALEIFERSWEKLKGLDVFVVDALRYKPHPSHAHLEKTLAWIKRAAPAKAVLTNMHIDLDYATLDDLTEDHILPAYDGMRIELGS
jgi:hypothetical protein